MEAKKLHYFAWSNACEPLHSRGLGIRVMHNFNYAKKVWDRCKMGSLNEEVLRLWRQHIKLKYFPNTTFLLAKEKSHDSKVWKNLNFIKPLLFLSLRWEARNGEVVNVWSDNLVKGLNGELSHFRPQECALVTMNQLTNN